MQASAAYKKEIPGGVPGAGGGEAGAGGGGGPAFPCVNSVSDLAELPGMVCHLHVQLESALFP